MILPSDLGEIQPDPTPLPPPRPSPSTEKQNYSESYEKASQKIDEVLQYNIASSEILLEITPSWNWKSKFIPFLW